MLDVLRGDPTAVGGSCKPHARLSQDRLSPALSPPSCAAIYGNLGILQARLCRVVRALVCCWDSIRMVGRTKFFATRTPEDDTRQQYHVTCVVSHIKRPMRRTRTQMSASVLNTRPWPHESGAHLPCVWVGRPAQRYITSPPCHTHYRSQTRP